MRKKELKGRIIYLETKVKRLEWEVRQAEMERLRAVEELEEKSDALTEALGKNVKHTNDKLKLVTKIIELNDELKAVRSRNQKLQKEVNDNYSWGMEDMDVNNAAVPKTLRR